VSAVHFVVPAGIDDLSRPSGGNAYDRRIVRGLAAAGWTVHVHEVPGSWPIPDPQSLRALASAVRGISDGALVLLDGLVASTAPEVLTREARRLRLVVLVHMPLGYGATRGSAREREAAVLSAAASVLTTSAWTRQALLQLYSLPADRVYVAEPGVDSAELARGTATAGALLSVAAVIPGKGHDVLLEALAPLTSLCWQCQCVGSLERDPAFVERLRRRVLDGGMDGRVSFAGQQAEADLARSYSKADVLVLPSRSETYGMVITEALARGLPVLAAEVGGVPEAMGQGADGTQPGLLVPPDNPSALRNAIRSWLEDARLRRRLRTAALERRASLANWSMTISAVAEALEGAER
jgi:glycosyltransferase involved in cell wall biosynthesis